MRGPIPATEAGARVRRARLVVLRAAGTLGLAAACALGCASRARPGVTHRVVIHGFAFDPAEIAVSPGDTVIWVNQDLVPHTATSRRGGWDTGSIGPDSSARVVIGPRSFGPYTCVFHANMRALLTRASAGAGPSAAPAPSKSRSE